VLAAYAVQAFCLPASCTRTAQATDSFSAASGLYCQGFGPRAVFRNRPEQALERERKLHTFQMAAGRAPEADDAIRQLASWARPRLGL
jgi:hypothetical protein